MPLPSPFNEISTIIPASIGWVSSPQDWIAKHQVGYPSDTSKPTKLWADLGVQWFPQRLFEIQYYTVLALNADGTPALTPIESDAAYKTYSSTVMNTYREYKYNFPNGIPYVKTLGLMGVEAKDYNVVGGQNFAPYGYPIQVGTNQMLVIINGQIAVVDYQAYIKAVTPQINYSDEDKVQMVTQILANTSMSASNKIAMIRKFIQNIPTPDPLT